MSVYFVREGDNGPVKIGVTTHVKTRMAGLQVGHHRPLTVIRVIENAFYETEEWFHLRYADRRLRGEWFDFCDDMLTAEPPLECEADVSIPQREKTATRIYLDTTLLERLRDVAEKEDRSMSQQLNYMLRKLLPPSET